MFVEKQEGATEDTEKETTTDPFEIHSKASGCCPVEKEINRVIGLPHTFFDHGQVRVEDAHAGLNILVEISRKLALRIIRKQIRDTPVDIEWTEENEKGN